MVCPKERPARSKTNIITTLFISLLISYFRAKRRRFAIGTLPLARRELRSILIIFTSFGTLASRQRPIM
jgi:hypothetical protein